MREKSAHRQLLAEPRYRPPRLAQFAINSPEPHFDINHLGLAVLLKVLRENHAVAARLPFHLEQNAI
jgi:hypothetical protein